MTDPIQDKVDDYLEQFKKIMDGLMSEKDVEEFCDAVASAFGYLLVATTRIAVATTQLHTDTWHSSEKNLEQLKKLISLLEK